MLVVHAPPSIVYTLSTPDETSHLHRSWHSLAFGTDFERNWVLQDSWKYECETHSENQLENCIYIVHQSKKKTGPK